MPLIAVNPAVTIPLDLRGRAIVQLLLAAIGFWERHRVTLAPVIDTRLSAILDSLADAVLLVKQIATPGPN